MNLRHFYVCCLGISLGFIGLNPAQAAPPGNDLVTPEVLSDIRSFIDQEIVRLSIISQNEKYKNFTEEDVLRMDAQWVKERKETSQPLISATLSNPLSSYLTRVQAHSNGLYTEIFAMDNHGLNVGQSSISSDYWQGDEAKFQKTFPNGGTAVFIDDPEFNDDNQSWHVQVNIAISDGTNPESIGAATIEVNLTELQRRQRAGAKAPEPEPQPVVIPEQPQPEVIVEPQAEPAPDTASEAAPGTNPVSE